MEFGVLGPLQVVDGGELVGLGSAQQRAVLALLILHAPEPVSLDRLIDELWGEQPPATAQHAVQVYVSGIRKLLRVGGGEVAVRTSPSGYSMDVASERIDARRFERLLDEAQRAVTDDPSQGRKLFEEALALWRGPPLAEFEASELARREASRLEELRMLAVEGLVEARLAYGEHVEVIGTITSLVDASPLRERPRRLLMLALYRSGRHAEALAAYRDTCAALDEIGLQPGPELRQLEEAILRHDASLRVPSSRADAAAEVMSSVAGGLVGLDDPAETEPGPTGAADGVGRREMLAPAGRRKVVTVLFCDVTGSTALGEALDPEALHGVMNRYFAQLRSTIERHGGTVDKFIGDAVMAVFGIPRVHEDDALRAVRAADEIRQRLPALADEVGVALSFRTAVNTGLVLVGDGENLAIGDAVNVAARLEQAAVSGEILLGEKTVSLVRDAVEVEPLEPLVLKGKFASVRAFRLLHVDLLAPGFARHLDVPLVGREPELRQLREVWYRAVQKSGCHLFTLLGAAGVGKSRLVAELLKGVGEEATVLQGRCLPYGEGITFWPVVEALTAAGEPAQPLLERLRGGGAATPEELFWEVRRLLESLSAKQPVILHVDDLQWAEPMLLDLLDHVVDLSRGTPILMLCTARPELLEDRPGWSGGKLNASTVLLEALDGAECEVLLNQLGDGLGPDARARVVAASQGNPLFLEEMVALARDGETATVPPTIQALLAARLERLAPEERELLERGAVEGEVFHRRAVEALADKGSKRELESCLAKLVRQELIRPHPATVGEGEAFRFRHLLIRDAAYDGLAKATRAELHARFASWLEQTAGDLAEFDEIAGWHLEQTVHYLRELGRQADHSVALRAAAHLQAAGRRAGARSDTAAARSLLERALALATERSPAHALIAVDLAEQLIDSSDLARVDELLAAAEQDPQAAGPAALTRLVWLIRAQPQDAIRTIQSRLPGMLEQLSRAGDDRGLAKAHIAAHWAHWLGSQAAAASEEARLAAEHARRAGDEGLLSRALAMSAIGLGVGPHDPLVVAEELSRIDHEGSGPVVATATQLTRVDLARLNGDFAAARQFAQSAAESFEALGKPISAANVWGILAEAELSAGDPAAALALLQRSDRVLGEFGERSFRSTIQARLAQTFEQLADRPAAEAAVELSDELSAPEDVINYAITHAVRARLAVADGDPEAADGWGHSAVKHADQTDFIVYRANARLELARVLGATGHGNAALHARAALELFEAKGDRPGAAEARALLDELPPVRRPGGCLGTCIDSALPQSSKDKS